MKRAPTILILILIVFTIVGISFLLFNKRDKSKSHKAEASSSSMALSSAADWAANSSIANINLSSPGSFSIDAKGTSEVAGGVFSYASCAGPVQYPELIHDGDTGTGVSMGCVGNYTEWDFGETRTISQVKTFIVEVDTNPATTPEVSVQYWNGSMWTEMYKAILLGASWETHNIDPAVQGSKIRYVHQMNPLGSPSEAVDFSETVASSGATGNLVSGATQIDGSEGATKNFIAWETFTPTYSLIANTNVKFRLRTSPDAATWTSWSAYQTPASAAPLDISAIVDSASGANKYLQVETTLENTDGASTPSVDSYSVQYHTDVKPNKPTAATAVVQ